MKKLAILTTLMAGVGLSFGQAVYNAGVVTFVNNESQKVAPATSHLVTNGTTGALLLGTQYTAELYYLNTTSSSMTPIAATISTFKSTTATTLKGTWNGGAAVVLPAGYGGIDIVDDGSGGGTFAEAGDATLLNYSASTAAAAGGNQAGFYPVRMEVRVWDSTFGASFETANGGLKGVSPQFWYIQRYTGNPPPTSDTLMVAQQGFAVVPEPSAIALSIIGVAGLLLIRRRK